MKYYGLKKKRFKEDILYKYAKERAHFLSLCPGKNKEFWKTCYGFFDRENSFMVDRAERYKNSIPAHGELNLDHIIISDLIRREDIHKLQSGVRYLLKKRRSSKFLSLKPEGIDEICKRIEKMDSTLLSWYELLECGTFEVNSRELRKSVDHYFLNIRNVNSAFLSVEIVAFLTDEKKNEIASIINSNYVENRGYAYASLTAKSNKCGSFKNYTVMHYNNNLLKADKIYEIVSCLEWEILEELKTKLPLVLHSKEIMPPKIEIYYTNIDYRDENTLFWNSIGVEANNGQFIDEQQKMFFNSSLSGRYESDQIRDRLMYIVKDDGIEIGHFESVKDHVYDHMRYNATYYFEIMFLNILAKDTGREIVRSKRKLDKIKLQKNCLNRLLKLKYNLSCKIDDYDRYTRDDKWDHIKINLLPIYEGDIKSIQKSTYRTFSVEDFIENALADKRKIDQDICIIYDEYEDKRLILQNLSDYKNSSNNMRINILMLVISILTLYFVVFPDKAIDFANMIREILQN